MITVSGEEEPVKIEGVFENSDGSFTVTDSDEYTYRRYQVNNVFVWDAVIGTFHHRIHDSEQMEQLFKEFMHRKG